VRLSFKDKAVVGAHIYFNPHSQTGRPSIDPQPLIRMLIVGAEFDWRRVSRSGIVLARVHRAHGPFGPPAWPIGAYRLSLSPRCRGVASE